jgi:hypothetical protein
MRGFFYAKDLENQELHEKTQLKTFLNKTKKNN